DTGDGRVRDFLFDPSDTTSCAHPDPTSGCPSQAIPPSPQESGWKDVFIAPPFSVTRIGLRLAPQSVKESDLFPGKNTFPFDPTDGPGYVWHCHILDHEDNDMMRPMEITFKHLTSLNSAPGQENALDTAPAFIKPAHDHNGAMPTTEQQMNKGASPSPMSMPMPQPEQQLK